MYRSFSGLHTLIVLVTCFGAVRTVPAAAPQAAPHAPPLALVQEIPLPDVKGRLDHLAVDLEGRRLFVAALGNDSVEVVDLAAGKVSGRITGLSEPQGVFYLPASHRLWVSNGGSSSVSTYDARTLKHLRRIEATQDADNIRGDLASGTLYVGCGAAGTAGLTILDSTDEALQSTILLKGHPEAFEIEKEGMRIFVNVPSAHHVAVVDRVRQQVIAAWPLEARANYPMALDEAHERLFVGCRHPASLLILDTASGKTVTSLEAPGDADDIFYDARNHLIYVIGGAGKIGVYEQTESDTYDLRAEVTTREGTRTGWFVPEWSRLYVAAPRSANKDAAILVFQVPAENARK
jgi:hypothetical protein